MKKVFALVACLWLASCSSLNDTARAIEEGEENTSFHYQVIIYPGLDENFDPNPTLTLAELNQLKQLDEYCAVQTVEALAGLPKEMFRQGITFGLLNAIFGSLGAELAFGSTINPREYFEYFGMAGVGNGTASGINTYQQMENVVQGYCMTGMVYKADELEGKLRRIFIVPMYVGNAEMPEVGDKPAPNFRGGSATSFPLR